MTEIPETGFLQWKKVLWLMVYNNTPRSSSPVYSACSQGVVDGNTRMCTEEGSNNKAGKNTTRYMWVRLMSPAFS